MVRAGLLSVLLLSVSLVTAAHDHRGEVETDYVSEGHLLLLRCPLAKTGSNVSWSRAGSETGIGAGAGPPDMSLPSGVKVQDGMLWFLPVNRSHNGNYSCETSGGLSLKMEVLVSEGACPPPPETMVIPLSVSMELLCRQTEVFGLNATRSVRWVKDCGSVVSGTVDERGSMRLCPGAEEDAGTYTCQVELVLAGETYTSAHSVQVTVPKDTSGTISPKPEVLFPLKEVVVVEVGSRVELSCKAFVGFSRFHSTMMFWTVNNGFPEPQDGLEETVSYSREGGRVYGLSNLSISNVTRLLLNVPILCHITTQTGQSQGAVFLQEADHSALYLWVSLCLAAVLTSVSLLAVFLFFRADVILIYRKVRRFFPKQVPDGKKYDGYVSFLHTAGSAEAVTFALQTLPKELENKHGYSLYIRGRDDRPGEAVHDAMAGTLHLCRRLLIVLSSLETIKDSGDGKKEESSALCDEHNQLCYEQAIGICDALTRNDPRVILVEVGGPVDYSRLSESLRYIKRKQGALRWRPASAGTHALSKVHSNRRFWTKLRYHMPSQPVDRSQSVV